MKCGHILPSGAPCKNWAIQGSDPPLCRHHGGGKPKPLASRPCTHIHPTGQPCAQWAVHGSDPPLCVAHAGLTHKAKGRNNGMWRHGFYEGENEEYETLEDMIQALFKRHSQADGHFDYIADPHELLTLLSLHFKNARIIGQLLRDQQVLDGDKDDLLTILGPALELIEAELESK